MNNTRILFVGFFFEHRNHREFSPHEFDNYHEYRESILKFIDTFSNMEMVFVTDEDTYTFISNAGRNTKNVLVVDFEQTSTYKKYFDLLNLKFNSENSVSQHNIIKTLLIWHFKFELIKICESRYDFEYLCYVDSGIFRPGRIRYVQEFLSSGLKINNLKEIVINYQESFMANDIDLQSLLNHGHFEISCNSFILNRSIIEYVYHKYFDILDDLINKGVNTTEQRIFTLIMRELWKKNPNRFNLAGQGSSYDINYHL